MSCGSMYSVCLRYVNDYAEANDVLQDSFLKVFKKIDLYDNKYSFKNWVKRIVINTAISNYRKNHKHYTNINISDINEDKLCDYVHDNSKYSMEELLLIIKSLTPGCKIIFNMYAIDGYTHKEIGNMLDISESTSKSQYFKAKAMIRKKLNSYGKKY